MISVFLGSIILVFPIFLCTLHPLVPTPVWWLILEFSRTIIYILHNTVPRLENIFYVYNLLLGAYPRQDVAVQMSLRNWCLPSATMLAAAIVPNVSVMSFSHLCLGFPRLLFPATIPCIIVFSKPSWRVTWPKYFSCWRLTKLYSRFVGKCSSFNIEQLVRWAIQGIRNILR